MLHITCPEHGIICVAEKIREYFPLVNKLVNTGKKNCMKVSGPLAPTHCKIGTWLQAALIYSQNWNIFRDVITFLEEDAASFVKMVVFTFSKKFELYLFICFLGEDVAKDLTFFHAHVSSILLIIEKLEPNQNEGQTAETNSIFSRISR